MHSNADGEERNNSTFDPAKIKVCERIGYDSSCHLDNSYSFDVMGYVER